MEISRTVADEIEEKVKNAVKTGRPLAVKTFTLPHNIEMYIEKIMAIFLKHTKKEQIKDYIIYCTKELIINAKKANTKRVYFSERGLDLGNLSDYTEGMKLFKEEPFGNINYYLQKQKERGLYIKVVLRVKDNMIIIEVRNNAEITDHELRRIEYRVVTAHKYKSLEEAMAEVMDDKEGAGLGLVILVLMMKKLGYERDCLKITSKGKETIASITIPLK